MVCSYLLHGCDVIRLLNRRGSKLYSNTFSILETCTNNLCLFCLFLWLGKEMTIVYSPKLIFRETVLFYILFKLMITNRIHGCIAYKNEKILLIVQDRSDYIQIQTAHIDKNYSLSNGHLIEDCAEWHINYLHKHNA